MRDRVEGAIEAGASRPHVLFGFLLTAACGLAAAWLQAAGAGGQAIAAWCLALTFGLLSLVPLACARLRDGA